MNKLHSVSDIAFMRSGLRIRGNTLRLRLSRSEVDLVGQGKEVEESTSFPGGVSSNMC